MLKVWQRFVENQLGRENRMLILTHESRHLPFTADVVKHFQNY